MPDCITAAEVRQFEDPRRTYSRSEIAALYAAHGRGEIVGPQWARLEFLLIRAGAEGRILGGLDINDRGEKGPSR
jgi:hypothetical protein